MQMTEPLVDLGVGNARIAFFYRLFEPAESLIGLITRRKNLGDLI